MTKYVALLRGINVGGNSKVDMKKLKQAMEGPLGKKSFQNVSTYINSGNVIFDSPENDKGVLHEGIESLLEKTFGFRIPIVIRDLGEIKKVVKAIPAEWVNGADYKTDVLFLWDDYCSKKTLKLLKQTEGVDNLIYVAGSIVWNIEVKNYGRSGMNKFIGSEVYKHMTARNVNTLRKLLELMSA